MEETLNLTQEWDKTFPKSEKVNHRKVTFHNRYGITLAADLYESQKMPKENCQQLLYVDLLEQSKNKHQDCMLKTWQKEDF